MKVQSRITKNGISSKMRNTMMTTMGSVYYEMSVDESVVAVDSNSS